MRYQDILDRDRRRARNWVGVVVVGLVAGMLAGARVAKGEWCWGGCESQKQMDKASEERERRKATARRYFTFDVLECDINPVKHDLFIRLRNCRGGGNRTPHEEMAVVICSHGVCWEDE